MLRTTIKDFRCGPTFGERRRLRWPGPIQRNVWRVGFLSCFSEDAKLAKVKGKPGIDQGWPTAGKSVMTFVFNLPLTGIRIGSCPVFFRAVFFRGLAAFCRPSERLLSNRDHFGREQPSL